MPALLLTDVLRALSLPAADALVAELHGGDTRRSPDLPGARCACRALRDLVDHSLFSLRLRPGACDVARWRAGWLPPSLARWPRANYIVIDFDNAADADALLLVAPILEGARQRLTQLTLEDDTYRGSGHFRGLEVAVAALAPRLPVLRSLSLTGLGMAAAMSYDPAQQAAMNRALAALPCLASLVLPSCRSLDCAGPLAGSSSLRSLTVGDSSWYREADPAPLTQQALANINSLQRLQRLTLCCGLRWRSSAGADDTGGLLALLASLPPSVEELKIETLVDSDYVDHQPPVELEGLDVAVGLRQGWIRSLRLTGQDFSLEHVSMLAGALLSCPTLGYSLEQLELASPLQVLRDDEVQLMQPLLQLLGRCQRVSLRALHLFSGRSMEGAELSVEGAQEVLCRLPPPAEAVRLSGPAWGRDLHVRFRGPYSPLSASASAATGNPTTGAAMAVAGEQPSRQDWSRNRNPSGPTPTELLRAAVQRWAEPGMANAGGTGVLLRGPTVAGLVGSPQDLTAWVRRLAERAGVAAGGPLGSARAESFRAIPPAAAVLLQCDSKDTAHAVAAAARAAELEAAVATAAALMPAGAAGAVEAAEEGSEAHATVVVAYLYCGLGDWASEVAQEVQAGGHGAGAWNEWERVSCVLELWAELGHLPEQVRL